MPRLKTIRPKWALTVEQASALFEHLPWLMPRTMVGLALLRRLRRGELFAFRWRDFDEAESLPARRRGRLRRRVRHARRPMPACGRSRCRRRGAPTAAGMAEPSATDGTGRSDLLDGVRASRSRPTMSFVRWVWPACQAAGLSSRDLAHLPADVLIVGTRQGRPAEGGRGDHGAHEGRHDAQRLHAGARRAARDAAERIGSELARIGQSPEGRRR